jgi:hypothetical protein
LFFTNAELAADKSAATGGLLWHLLTEDAKTDDLKRAAQTSARVVAEASAPDWGVPDWALGY